MNTIRVIYQNSYDTCMLSVKAINWLKDIVGADNIEVCISDMYDPVYVECVEHVGADTCMYGELNYDGACAEFAYRIHEYDGAECIGNREDEYYIVFFC